MEPWDKQCIVWPCPKVSLKRGWILDKFSFLKRLPPGKNQSNTLLFTFYPGRKWVYFSICLLIALIFIISWKTLISSAASAQVCNYVIHCTAEPSILAGCKWYLEPETATTICIPVELAAFVLSFTFDAVKNGSRWECTKFEVPWAVCLRFVPSLL